MYELQRQSDINTDVDKIHMLSNLEHRVKFRDRYGKFPNKIIMEELGKLGITI